MKIKYDYKFPVADKWKHAKAERRNRKRVSKQNKLSSNLQRFATKGRWTFKKIQNKNQQNSFTQILK